MHEKLCFLFCIQQILLLELEQTQQNIEQENRLTILWNSHHELYLYKHIAFSVSCGYLNHFWKKYR